MAYTDYKFWYVKRDDDGFITEVAVRFYEGEYQIVDGEEQYVRTKRLSASEGELDHLANESGTVEVSKEINGAEAIVYTQEQLGKLQTDEDLKAFLKQEIAKDQTRLVINEQK